MTNDAAQAPNELETTIKCELCGKVYQQITRSHLRVSHNLTTDEYRALGYQTLSPARLWQLRHAGNEPPHYFGDSHPRYKGGSLSARGYRIIYIDGKSHYEHRVVAAQKLGRPLRKGEVVHHLDGDKTNNSPDNLEVMMQPEHNRRDANARIYHNITPATMLKARELHSEGMSFRAIARLMGHTASAVTKWVKMSEADFMVYYKDHLLKSYPDVVH